MDHGFRSQINYHGSTIKNLHMWDFQIETPDGVPVQPNAWDCGVFVIKFMEEHGRDSKDYKKEEVIGAIESLTCYNVSNE